MHFFNTGTIVIILLLLSAVDGRRRTRTSTTTTRRTTRAAATTAKATTTVRRVTTTRLTTLRPTTTTTRLATTTTRPTTTTTRPTTTTTRLTTTTTRPTTTTTRPTTTTSQAITATTSSGSAIVETLYRQQALAQTNYRRAQHCAQPLTYSPNITAIAQSYAEFLCVNKSFLHSGNRYQGNYMGENLFAFSSSAPISFNGRNGSTPVESWYSEIAYYNFSNPGYTWQTGHFTQTVWLNSQIFGLGYCCTNDSLKCYVVANYYPGGNIIGAFANNVLAPTCG